LDTCIARPYSVVPVVAAAVPSVDEEDDPELEASDVEADVADEVSCASAAAMSSEDACCPSVREVMTRTSS
jgi:hypothetical protein